MATLSAYGLTVDAPAGWDGSIYKRQGGDFALQSLSSEQQALHAVELQPIVHLCTRPLPVDRGDLGGGVVAGLGADDVFIVLFEYGPTASGAPLFAAATGAPWPLAVEDFDAASLRTQLPGQLGCQRFFSLGSRSFMLYAVLGGDANRRRSVQAVNTALAGVRVG